MIYLDHAATSYPKLPTVINAAGRSLTCYGANPGRGGYPMAMATTEQLYICRERLATLFGLSDPRCVVFMPSCTAALNTVINHVLQCAGRVVISDLEHNAVVRPLYALSRAGVRYDIAHVTAEDDEATVESFRRNIHSNTRAIICTHASNVTGGVLPIARLAALAHEYGIPIVVDAAQSAGHLSIDIERDGIDYMCVAGHKGLGGMMGTGLLLCRENTAVKPLIYGGTGSHSLSEEQPEELPESLESGTPNVAGICALRAGTEHLLSVGINRVASYEQALCAKLYEGLCSFPSVDMHSPYPCVGKTVSVLSFTVKNTPSQEIGDRLARHGIAARCGLHCAPSAHRSIGTLPFGTVRLSVGITNSMTEMETALKIFKKIL